MNKFLALAFAGLSLSSISAHASCIEQLPLALKYGVSYLSLMEKGGLNLLDDTHVGRTPEQVCQDLTSSDIQLLSNQGDYAAIMGFADKTCTVKMRLNGEGKFYYITLQSCVAK